MPTEAVKPVILVAFANDSAAGANYLRNLPEEARRIRAALDYAEQQGLCEFELLYNVTLDDIVSAFQNPKYQDRIAVLHYGGHAESYNLLFQAADGSLSRIDAHGFAAFLAEQHSLQLVFLNACSTEPQVDDLLAAKVQAVIATSEEVDDAVATDLADAFYQALAHGASIGSAYRQAVAKLRAAHGDDPTAFYTLGFAPPMDEPPPAPPDQGPAQPPAQPSVQPPAGTSPTTDAQPQAAQPAASAPAAETPASAPAAAQPPSATDQPATALPPAQPAAGTAAGPGDAAQTIIQPTAGATGSAAPAAPSQPPTNGAAAAAPPAVPEPPTPPAAPTENLAGATSGGYWPWHLRWRPGAEASVEWSLPIAAGDPLFGLPPLPPGPLPDSPYHRALDYYSRDLAELFFGRGREIRDLYDRVTTAGAASVILYYGQSGVGKSSLLDAGLAPRLANTHTVLYTRRDASLGLLQTLYRQMGQVDPNVTLAQAWRTAEDKAGKPVVLILDQVEELFTRRNPDQPNELADFAAALRTLSGDARTRPQGALLLGFRKERLAEIESALRDQRIDYAKVYLAPLDANGVEEVVVGPTRSDRLKAKYGLIVDPDLPEVIARDLTADPDSPVAPTLHILLLKLWNAATALAASQPHFTLALYEQLRRDGILLDDFLRQQIVAIAQEQPDAVSSGFLLDLLEYHTTSLGTAEQHTAKEVHDRYPQRADLDAVLLRCKDLYLLADPAGDKVTPTASSGTRLAHDTLAPLVRRDFANSNLPAQQARRLLESRAVDWQNGQTGALLDDASLAVLAKGQPGMRALTADEQRLVQASTAAQAARARRQRIVRIAALATGVILLLLVIFSFYQYSNSVASALNAANAQATAVASDLNAANAQATAAASDLIAANQRIQAQRAVDQSRSAQFNTQLANLTARTNESQRLTQLARRQLDLDPVLSLNLALQALPKSPGDPLLPEAEHMLRQAVLTSRERKWITDTLTSPSQAAFQGDRLAVGGATPAVYDLNLNPVNLPFPPDFGVVQGLQWGTDGRLLAWNDSTAWVLGSAQAQHFATSDGLHCAQWQPQQRWVAVCTDNNLYAWQIDSGRALTLTDALDPNAWNMDRLAAWSPDGRWLAAAGSRLALWDSQSPDAPAPTFDVAQKTSQIPTLLDWLPDGKTLLVGFSSPEGNLLRRWDAGMAALEPITIPVAAAAHGELRALPLPGIQGGSPRVLLWSKDGYLAVIGLDGTLQTEAAYIESNLRDVALSPDHSLLLGYSANGTASVWSTADLKQVVQLNGSTNFQSGPIERGFWLNAKTVVLADAQGLIQVVDIDPAFLAADPQSLGITPLAGYDKTESPALVASLPAGRLLTVGYRTDDQPSSIRIWQQAQVPLSTANGLPGADAPLCSQLQQSLQVTGLISDVATARWPAADALLLQDSYGNVVRWPLPGDPLVLDADPAQLGVAVSPNGKRALQFGGAVNKLWRAGSADWVRNGTLPGTIITATWTAAGIVAQSDDSSIALINPDSGDKLPLPGDINLDAAQTLSSTLLLAVRSATLDLIDTQTGEDITSWPLPPNSAPRTVDVQPGRAVLYKSQSGDIHLLEFDPARSTLRERWKSDQRFVNAGVAKLHPTLPLLANIDNYVLAVVDAGSGSVLWRSTSDSTVATHAFFDARWSADGKHLVAEVQPAGAGNFDRLVDVFRWNDQDRRLDLLQEMPAASLLAVSPDSNYILASEPRRPYATQVRLYPLFADTPALVGQVNASCLLDRPTADVQR